MLRIVLPARVSEAAANAAATRLLRRAVAVTDVVAVTAANVRVAVEIIIVVYVDVVVAAPSGAPAPAAAPERPHSNADAEGNRDPCGVIACRRVVDRRIRIDRWTVHHHGIIRRHIHYLRIGLFDDNYTLALNDFGFHLLLLGRFQIASILSLFAHALNGIHHVVLLRQERVA